MSPLQPPSAQAPKCPRCGQKLPPSLRWPRDPSAPPPPPASAPGARAVTAKDSDKLEDRADAARDLITKAAAQLDPGGDHGGGPASTTGNREWQEAGRLLAEAEAAIGRALEG